MALHPTQERWTHLGDDRGYIHRIDLLSRKLVRRVCAGSNGASLAGSSDGRYLAAGSHVPNTAVILDAASCEPLKRVELRGFDPHVKTVDSDPGIIIATPSWTNSSSRSNRLAVPGSSICTGRRCRSRGSRA
ncbi:MAG: hypothetical protein LC136_07455 [Burkholderiales bacterium]|nr:hypothetical protein [Anaerolineae bacterium]MCZ2414074.1 hypothetical protein [Burkholderiales bacterium]